MLRSMKNKKQLKKLINLWVRMQYMYLLLENLLMNSKYSLNVKIKNYKINKNVWKPRLSFLIKKFPKLNITIKSLVTRLSTL
jgi:hypothetical protein